MLRKRSRVVRADYIAIVHFCADLESYLIQVILKSLIEYTRDDDDI